MKKIIFKISIILVVLFSFSFKAEAQFNLRVKNTSASGAPVIVRVYDASSNLLYTSGTIANNSSVFVTITTCTGGIPATVHIIDQGTTFCLTNIPVNLIRSQDPTLGCSSIPPFTCCDLKYNYFTTSQTTSFACGPLTYDLDITID
ncbi:MAG: hypothetical protein PSX81_08595 [bacterium]|nr:hypothetical protein [bacterium]